MVKLGTLWAFSPGQVPTGGCLVLRGEGIIWKSWTHGEISAVVGYNLRHLMPEDG